MKNNIELVNKIKNGDKKLEDYLKTTLLKSLEGININDKEILVDKVFKEGLESYNSKIIVPLKFYLLNLLRKEISSTQKCIFSLEEQKIINLYLTKIDNKYLSDKEISIKLNINITKVNAIINKFNNIILNPDDKLDMENIFPNYLEKINQKKEYYKINKIITFEQINLIAYYIGKVTGYPLSIDELADIYKKDPSTIFKELKVAFNLLKDNNNVVIFIKEYPNTKRELVTKANELNIKLLNIKAKHYIPYKVFLSNELKVLDELSKTKDENLTDEEMAARLNFTVPHYRSEKTKLFNKVRQNKKLQELIAEKYDGLDILRDEDKLTEKQIKLIESIKEFEETPENYEKIIKEGEYQNLPTFINEINTLNRFLRKNTYLMKDVLSIYKHFDFNKKILTSFEAEMLEIFIEADKQNISLEEAAKQLNYYDEKKNYALIKKEVIKRIKKNRILASQVSRIYEGIMSSKDEVLNSREKEMLSLLNKHKDNPLNDEIIAKLLRYKTTKSYNIAKAKLINKIKAYPKLLTRVREIYQEFDVNDIDNLSYNEKIILEIINNSCYTAKTEEELANEFGYNFGTYLCIRNTLFKKIKNNEELLKNIKKKYPAFSLKQKNNSINNLVIKEEIMVLRKDYKLNKDQDNLLKQALKSLETDFYDCLEDYTFEDKLLLAIILRYYKGIKFSFEDISSILNVDEEYITNLINSLITSSHTKEQEKKLKKILKS